jgi:hypothetical protein
LTSFLPSPPAEAIVLVAAVSKGGKMDKTDNNIARAAFTESESYIYIFFNKDYLYLPSHPYSAS